VRELLVAIELGMRPRLLRKGTQVRRVHLFELSVVQVGPEEEDQ
jgi:hypothetical protein